MESQLCDCVITLMCKVAVTSVSPRNTFWAILCVSLYVCLLECGLVTWIPAENSVLLCHNCEIM
jgi:hypothetical protein